MAPKASSIGQIFRYNICSMAWEFFRLGSSAFSYLHLGRPLRFFPWIWNSRLPIISISQIRPQNSNLEFWSRFLEFRERQIRDKHFLCHDGCTTKPTGFDGFELVVAYNTCKEWQWARWERKEFSCWGCGPACCFDHTSTPEEVARLEIQRNCLPAGNLNEEEWVTVYGYCLILSFVFYGFTYLLFGFNLSSSWHLDSGEKLWAVFQGDDKRRRKIWAWKIPSP